MNVSDDEWEESAELSARSGWAGVPLSSCEPDMLEIASIPAWNATESGPIIRGGNRGLTDYIARAHDEVLAEKIKQAHGGVSAVITLFSDSTAGMKRAFWEAIHRLDPGTGEPLLRDWLVYPEMSPDPAAALAAAIPTIGPRTVLWLPGFDRYVLGDASIGEAIAKALRTLRVRFPVLIFLTLRPSPFGVLTAPHCPGSADLYPHVRRLLLDSHLIEVRGKFSPAEVRRAAASRDPRVAEAAAGARDGRVVQYLAAIPVLAHRVDTEAASTVLACATQALLLGHDRRLPRAVLEHGTRALLSESVLNSLPPDWFDTAAADLTRPRAGNVSPLRAHPADPAADIDTEGTEYSLHDLLEWRHVRNAGASASVDPALWPVLVAHAGRGSLTALAEEARRRGLLRICVQLYQRAIRGGVEGARRALAEVLRDAGRVPDAVEQYERLADEGDEAAFAAAAQLLLSLVAKERAQPDADADAGKRAKDRARDVLVWTNWRPERHSPAARRCRAFAHIELGDQDSAITEFQYLAEHGDPEALLAAANLVVDRHGAEHALAWLDPLIAEGRADAVELAAEIMTDAYGTDAAVTMLRRQAKNGSHHAHLVGAELHLAQDPKEALNWCLVALEYGIAGAVPLAARICLERGRPDQARHYAMLAAQDGDPTILGAVAEAFAAQDSVEDALECLGDAHEHGLPDARARAAALTAAEGSTHDAFAFCQSAEHANAAPDFAAVALPLCHGGKAAQALPWFVANADISNPTVLLPFLRFLDGQDIAASVADAYAHRANSPRGRALAWVAEALALAGARERRQALPRHQSNGTVPFDSPPPQLALAAELFLAAAAEGYPSGYLRAGEVLAQTQRFSEAVAALEQARAAGMPGTDGPLAAAWVHQDRVEDAIGLARRCLDHDDPEAIAPVAQALLHAGRAAEADQRRAQAAASSASAALLADDDNMPGNPARLAEEETRYAEQAGRYRAKAAALRAQALELLRAGIEAGDIRAHHALGDHLARTGEHKQALAHYLHALLHGDDTVARNQENTPAKIQQALTALETSERLGDLRARRPAAPNTPRRLVDLRAHGITLQGEISAPWQMDIDDTPRYPRAAHKPPETTTQQIRQVRNANAGNARTVLQLGAVYGDVHVRGGSA
ncbi:hypothetical protein [Amycolatopsis sp. VC5-11]|uniref:hypothetical protein n=1 Tax=Amycolatopsis sp. VC5-11 TaxID=3120156 RepID=UPI00300A6D99